MVLLNNGKRSLNEKLERATKQHFNIIKKQMNSDLEFRRMLNTPMEKIPQYYWLYSETDGLEGSFPLVVVLEAFSKTNVSLLFSRIGDKITGFIAYKETPKEITRIKIASFLDDTKKSNPSLAADLINFVDKEIASRDKITWVANEGNKTTNDQYVRLLKSKNFKWSREKDPKRTYMWVYTVIGKKG